MNGYAIFLNNDGTETKLSWDELQLEENGEKYGYDINLIDNEIIGDTAFYETTIKEIEIPESVKYVDSDAFYKCKQLEKIIVPKGLIINGLKTKAIIERNNKNYEPLQIFFDKCEKNDIKLFNEEIDGLERGAFLIDFDENGNEERRDFNDYADALKLKDSNGERYFTISQLKEYYERSWESGNDDYKKDNEDIKQIVKFSERLGIKPNLENNLDKLREQYIEKIEERNKYLEKILKEYLPQKEKENERDNMPVQANERD